MANHETPAAPSDSVVSETVGAFCAVALLVLYALLGA